MADPRILIVLFCFFFLPAASRGTEKVLEGGVQARHPSNKLKIKGKNKQEMVSEEKNFNHYLKFHHNKNTVQNSKSTR